MAEDFNIKKLATSPFTLVFWVKVIMYSLGALLLFFIAMGLKKAYFSKPEPSTGITGNVETLNQDCSKQVSDAIVETEKRMKQKDPWVDLDFKIIRLSIPGKR